jgi:hypothetical protein
MLNAYSEACDIRQLLPLHHCLSKYFMSSGDSVAHISVPILQLPKNFAQIVIAAPGSARG